jgi:hypothetical protein
MAASRIGFAPNQNDVGRQSTGWPLKISLFERRRHVGADASREPGVDLEVGENGWPILQKVLASLIDRRWIPCIVKHLQVILSGLIGPPLLAEVWVPHQMLRCS